MHHKNDFLCAITKIEIKNVKISMLPMLFYKAPNGYIRVRIEHVKCLNCDWQGNIANPILADLYETVTDKYNEMKRGYQIPAIGCPKCKKALERYAIWIEDKSMICIARAGTTLVPMQCLGRRTIWIYFNRSAV